MIFDIFIPQKSYVGWGRYIASIRYHFLVFSPETMFKMKQNYKKNRNSSNSTGGKCLLLPQPGYGPVEVDFKTMVTKNLFIINLIKYYIIISQLHSEEKVSTV